MHTPVFGDQAIGALQIKQNGLYIDATTGEGGHTGKILELGGKVLAFDWDEKQIENLKSKIDSPNVTFVCSNFADIEEKAKEHGFAKVDGILFDYGLSMRQLAESKRGFSYLKKADPLDMRMNENTEQTAADLIRSLSADELYEILAGYSEEIHSRAISESIVSSRRLNSIKTVGELLFVIDRTLDRCTSKHDHHKQPIYARIFQALRIAVNDEFENIRKGLEGAVNLIKDDGRIVVITFHSLEDRVVKQFVRKHAGLKFLNDAALKSIDKRKFERSAMIRVIINR